MDCVNHSGVSATAYCQNCGKALCATCVRNAGNGQILCEPCWTSWQSLQQPFVAPPAGGPNPSVATVLGFIPGVGAMYNGQYFKGLIHVVIFVVIISITTHYGIFGLFIPAWILYQSFEAFHTAKAIRDGQPLPDPLGLNEVGNWLNLGGRPQGIPSRSRTGSRPRRTRIRCCAANRRRTSSTQSSGRRVPAGAVHGPVPGAVHPCSRVYRSGSTPCSAGAAPVLEAQGADRRSDPDRLRTDSVA